VAKETFQHQIIKPVCLCVDSEPSLFMRIHLFSSAWEAITALSTTKRLMDI